MKTIKLLIDLGADVYAKDNDGNNVIHFAAQGDQVASIYYFLNKFNFNLEEKNSSDSTALHWAAYLNNEVSLSFLIAWGSKINSVDKEDNTPLHLTVLVAERVRDTRWIKILLMKGADRNILNKNGMKPIDIVQEGDMKNELKDILK